jgi:DNA-binding transcriptional regulator YiaG
MSTTLLDEVRVSLSLPEPHAAREIRERAGVSRPRMGEELGVHDATIARWEAGTHAPRGAARVAYAQLLAGLDEIARGAREGGTAA